MDEQAVVKEICIPMYQAKGWLQFLAVMEILGGIMVALTIVGIIFAWLPIWQGVILFKAASSAEAAAVTGDKTQMIISLRQVKLYFMINGIVLLIGFGFGLLAFFFGGMLAAFG